MEKGHMKIKKGLKRAISLFCVVLLMCNNAWAVTDNGTGNYENTSHIPTKTQVEIAGRLDHFWSNSGIRFSIVDIYGRCVSNTVDIVKYLPWNINSTDGVSGSETGAKSLLDMYKNVTGAWDKPKENIVYLGGGKRDYSYNLSTGRLGNGASEPNGTGVKCWKFPMADDGTARHTIVKQTEEVDEDGNIHNLDGVEMLQGIEGKMYTANYIHDRLYKLLKNTGGVDLSKLNENYYGGVESQADMFGTYQVTEDGQIVDKKYIKKFPCALESYKTSSSGVTTQVFATGEYFTNFMMLPIRDDINLLHMFLSLEAPVTLGNGVPDKENLRNEKLLQFFSDKVRQEVEDRENKYNEEYKKQYGKDDNAAYAKSLIDIMQKYQYKLQCEAVTWSVPVITSSGIGLPMVSNIADKNIRWIYTSKDIVYGTIGDKALYLLKDYMRISGGKGRNSDQYKQFMASGGFDESIQYMNQESKEFNSYIQYATKGSLYCDVGWNDWITQGFTTKRITFENSGYPLYPYLGQVNGLSLGQLAGTAYQVAYGVIYFDIAPAKSEPKTRTWDEDIYSGSNYKPGPPPVPPVDPDNPGGDPGKVPDDPTKPSDPANPGGDPGKVPDDPTKPSDPADPGIPSNDPETPGNPDANINIVKFYSSKNGDGTYKYIENHVREKTVRNIQIDDEPGYKVDSWFTSIDYKKPTSSSESYDDTRSSVTPGSLSGDKPTLNIIIYTLTCPLK